MNTEDTIVIAPSVLLMTAANVARSIEGVARMGNVPDVVGRLFRGHPMGNGVVVEYLDDEKVKLDMYLVTKGDVNLVEVGTLVQKAVTRTLQDLAGIKVTAVNIHIEDVDYADAE